ncbi:MAG: bacteriocin-protection protein [Sphingobacteriales bacterium]|nr:MAG: bacteriocin-protection protein [Sphingobacteriales bacterium]
MEPHFFKTPAEFREWFDNNHTTETELLVGFYKKATGKSSITWPESVDEALCFGWIDGVRKSMGEESYTIRFTPRKATSIWSAVNIDKMEKLIAEGLVKPEGIAAYEKRKESRSRIYSHEQENTGFSAKAEEKFKSNESAWEFFMKQPPSYRKVIMHWVSSAKQEKTQLSRLEKAIAESAAGKRMT